jgi:hypothetical protein
LSIFINRLAGEGKEGMQTREEYNYAKEQLLKLDRGVLVDALLKLAIEPGSASLLVSGLIASQEERIVLFQDYIRRVTHQSRKTSLTGHQILQILTRALDLLDPERIAPKTGLQLLESFYLTDSWALESTTELDFDFEYLFTEVAYSLFDEFAVRCKDHEYVQTMIKRLLADDGYGMRGNLKNVTRL